MLESVLVKMGLSKGEAKIYLTLLKNGQSSVNQLSEKVSLHRPNIYDYLQKLVDKGLVNYSTEENVKRFSAVEPEKLLEFIQAKEDILRNHLQEFKKIQNTSEEEIKVEVYKGA
jgi:sugar-specific transcriptional regulator TrmB